MYLKAITLKGFKSFPDRTRLEFGPGVSVIVGPNGSGKSNVTDAVLWALGEQSPMAVRGQSMQDVIFAGAPGRQASAAAEVELVLDDAQGKLGLPTPEVSIVRRLDRAGEGEYRLAGARCRLVDVIEVLSDTGLGKEMHSVISQGRVESIVTSKPRDRRLLIEEAAGLGKHRKRRRRAQLKLARTQDNLDRALDVEREARSRLRPLKRQAEAAELHARLERQSLEARWSLARDDVRAQQAGLSEAQAAAVTARERRERVETELRAVAQRREAAEEALAARSAQREELSRRHFVAAAAAERVAMRAETIRSAEAAAAARLARAHALRDQLHSADDGTAAAAAGRDRLAALEQELASLERAREAELAEQLAELEGQLAAANEGVEKQNAAVEQAKAARAEAEAALERARQHLRDAERGVEQARREAARAGAELAAVNQFLRNHQAVPGGVAALADRLEVDPGYELALAAALDGRLGAAMVDDVAEAAALLDRTGAAGGRALVVGANRADPESSPSPVPGAERLAEHLHGAAEAVALARALLRDAWVVDELVDVPEAFAGTAVTRTGRVWSPPTRELRQAAAVGEERVLSERNRREQLIAASESAAQAEHAARAGLDAAAAELAGREDERRRAVDAHRVAVDSRDEATEVSRRVAKLIERRRGADDGEAAGRRAELRGEIAAAQAALERVERDRAQRRLQLERVEQTIAQNEALTPAIAALIEALEAAGAAIATRRATFEAALSADRAAGDELAAALRSCAQEEAALHARLHSENEALTALEVGAQRARDQLAEGEHVLTQLAARLELPADPAPEPLPEDEREALTARVERLARRREQLGPVNPLAQEEYASALEHAEELERQRTDLETALRELEKLIAETDRQIRERFDETFAAAARNFEELAGQLFPGGRGRLRLVSERDAPARVLGAQKPPASADAESDTAVEEGDEDFALEGEQEAQVGVEIEITPAGKEMKRLSLLSGGEKSMTALAFLFAVFLAKPCPFYILDEVEAALDDVNIDRFLDLLRQYSKRAQFIVVTHQKRTMEAADSLYGVSMGGDGISKVISRRLPPEQLAA